MAQHGTLVHERDMATCESTLSNSGNKHPLLQQLINADKNLFSDYYIF